MHERSSQLAKAYDPKAVERKWYSLWEERKYFTPKIDWTKKPFSIVLPPPNITGELHVGHALTATIEDIMVRWHRMLGEPTLWLPGEDHAGIGAQYVVEKELASKGLSRQQLGRQRFLEIMWDWAQKYRRRIADDHRALGASLDWTRERFTMDPDHSRAVRVTFVNLYHKGLIYRDERIINWCPRCLTALSDLETIHTEVDTQLYYVRYPLDGPEKGFITVATTRPETILGDTGVAVHPADERYRHMVGKFAILPVLRRRIPIVADPAVDPAFGTGAVKVTPAHDPVDFEIGQRHGLEPVNVMEPDGKMNQNAGPYQGLDRFEARARLVEQLRAEGLLEKAEPYHTSIGTCQRCSTVVEPRISLQWWVRVGPMAERALQAVRDGTIRIVPERFVKVYVNWMENIKDWCISRQLWWGHQIPVWHCRRCGQMTVPLPEAPMADPTACSRCGSPDVEQDPDVLDTWFSSALWPHSTLGWPDDTEDLRYFYPTSVLETGYDILFFWVARMIMLGLENTGKVPFHTVYLHGLVRDERGEKMSKTKGNVLSPIELIDKYGADALRFALATGSSPGNDMKLSEQKVEAGRNFSNKVWNAGRFVVMNVGQYRVQQIVDPEHPDLSLADRWILSRHNRLISDVNRLLRAYQFGEAGRQIWEFLWGDFCDWYIEIAKVQLAQEERADVTASVLASVMERSLRVLHPFMPFLTEELWQYLPHTGESIMVAPWPEPGPILSQAEEQFGLVKDLIHGIREVRSQFRVDPARWIEVFISAGQQDELLEGQRDIVSRLARVDPAKLHILREISPPPHSATVVVREVRAFLPLGAMLDVEQELARLDRELQGVRKELERVEELMARESFVQRAPAQIVERERERLKVLQAERDALEQRKRMLMGS